MPKKNKYKIIQNYFSKIYLNHFNNKFYIGTFTITPLQGISLDTLFTINLDNYWDEDVPLSYKYNMYNSENDYI